MSFSCNVHLCRTKFFYVTAPHVKLLHRQGYFLCTNAAGFTEVCELLCLSISNEGDFKMSQRHCNKHYLLTIYFLYTKQFSTAVLLSVDCFRCRNITAGATTDRNKNPRECILQSTVLFTIVETTKYNIFWLLWALTLWRNKDLTRQNITKKKVLSFFIFFTWRIVLWTQICPW
jgi:hypothetical protein